MKNLLVMAVATFFATNAFAAEMKWYGSADWRFSAASENDGLGSMNNSNANQDVSTTRYRAHELRANAGLTGGWEHVEYNIGFRTQTTGAANNEYLTINQGGGAALNFDQAYFRYVRDFGSLDFALTVGQQKNALVYDNQWETLFSNFDRWDGFGWNFKFGMFGINAAQYVLGATQHALLAPGSSSSKGSTTGSAYYATDATQGVASTTQRFAMLYSFQPYMNWKFSDEIEAMFSVGYYKWMYEGATNQIGGSQFAVGKQSNISGSATAGTIPSYANGLYRMDNNSQWDFLANVTLPYSLTFTGDLVLANKAYYSAASVLNTGSTGSGYGATTPTQVSNTAWTLGLTYGKLRKAQDFTIGYAYTSKGIASVIDGYTNDKFQADNKGHTFLFGYAPADNLHLGFRWMSLKEKQKLQSIGSATADGTAYTGNNVNEALKTSYWELTAGMAF